MLTDLSFDFNQELIDNLVHQRLLPSPKEPVKFHEYRSEDAESEYGDEGGGPGDLAGVQRQIVGDDTDLSDQIQGAEAGVEDAVIDCEPSVLSVGFQSDIDPGNSVCRHRRCVSKERFEVSDRHG